MWALALRRAFRQVGVLLAMVLVSVGTMACGSGLPVQKLGFPRIPTFHGCAVKPQKALSVIPGPPIDAISAVVRPTRAKSASQIPLLLAIYDGACVIWTQNKGETMEIGFKPGSNSQIFHQVARFLQSTGDFSLVTVTQ
jgi:hypothetical protein